MKLYSIVSDKNVKCSNLLKESCVKFNLEYIPLSITAEIPKDINLATSDFVYRISDDPRAIIFEKLLISLGMRSFHRSNNLSLVDLDNVLTASIIHEANGIPIPLSVFSVSRDRTSLEKQTKRLNFPLIVKITGGQKGVGVIKVDSLSSLLSVVDYLFEKKETFILREYIKSGQPPVSYRAVVLGDEVLFAYRNQSIHSNDFRSNVDQGNRRREAVTLSESEKSILIKSAHLLDLDFCGIDFLYRSSGDMAILEVNFPFNFSPIFYNLGFPIHEHIVRFIKELIA